MATREAVRLLCFSVGVEYSERLFDEVRFRCSGLNEDDSGIIRSIKACLRYVKEYGLSALINEYDDGAIWDFVA